MGGGGVAVGDALPERTRSRAARDEAGATSFNRFVGAGKEESARATRGTASRIEAADLTNQTDDVLTASTHGAAAMPKRSLTRKCPKFRRLLPRTLPRGLREAVDRWSHPSLSC
jgi:hypothetical protein